MTIVFRRFNEWTSVVGYERKNKTLTNYFDKRKAAFLHSHHG